MRSIENRSRNNKENIKRIISEKIKNEREKYCQSLDKFIMKRKEEEALQKEKAFQKYKNFVSNNNYLLLIIIVFQHERKETKTERTSKKFM